MRLNRDVYVYFASFVSSTKDLLALCLTSKEFLELAFPELEYRSIHCKLDNDALWIQLASNPVQASRIRSLEIGSKNILVPKSLNANVPPLEDGRALDSALKSNSDFDFYPDRMDGTRKAVKQSEYLLVQAIKKMLNLESFLWDWEPPSIYIGAEDEGTVHKEDIWTSLRDYTSLKSLKVLDFPDCVKTRPILDSSIFTLKDMTFLDLTFYYDPERHLDGGNYAQWTGSILKNGRVKIDGIKAVAKQCPRLESLSLAIIDRQFYYEFGGNPYTNLTSVLQDAHWPELTLLKLHDITIEDTVMTNFLLKHNKLETLSVFLSVTDLPTLPFHISSQVDLSQGNFLPNLKDITSDARLMRQVLRALKQTCFLQSINSIEPRDWGINHEAFLAPPRAFIRESAINIIDIPLMTRESDVALLPNDPDDTEPEYILRRMPDLCSLVIRNINRSDDLNDLPDLTPNLENIECDCMHRFFDGSGFSCRNILPTLTRWKRLKRFTGVSLWPHEEFAGVIDINSERVLTVAQEIKVALPLIEEMTWWDGHLMKFKVDDDGKLFLEKEQNEPGEY